jgi:SAM-dependent methyltransferase
MQEEKRQKIESILKDKPLSMRGEKFCFLDPQVLPVHTAAPGLFGFLQDFFKKYPRVYQFIVAELSPVSSTRSYRRVRDRLLSRFGKDKIMVNYGSGPAVLAGREDIINVDLFPFDGVDVLSETRLPFRDGTVDFFFCGAVLEHMRHPQTAVSEMFRCLKAGGEILVYVPFMAPLHAAPDDFQRWTEAGLRQLCGDFAVLESGMGAGPTCGFLWVLQHWVATVLSLGSSTAKDILLIVLMLATFPLKYLDVFYERFARAGDIASGFYLHGKRAVTGEARTAREAGVSVPLWAGHPRGTS